jgi:xylulokinase
MNDSFASRALSIDVGTGGLKAILMDENGRLVDEATAGCNLRSSQPGWAMQDPGTWWAAR